MSLKFQLLIPTRNDPVLGYHNETPIYMRNIENGLDCYMDDIQPPKAFSKEYVPTIGMNSMTVVFGNNGTMIKSIPISSDNVLNIYFEWWKKEIWPKMKDQLNMQNAFYAYTFILLPQKYNGSWNKSCWSILYKRLIEKQLFT